MKPKARRATSKPRNVAMMDWFDIDSVAMLREILSANTPEKKRAIITKTNPHFYLMFHDGVKGGSHGVSQ